MPTSLPSPSVTSNVPISSANIAWMQDCKGVLGLMVMGLLGCSTPMRSSIKLRSTQLEAMGRSNGVRSCWQLTHSSLPGRLTWPQHGQIMMTSLDDPHILALEQILDLALAL